MADYNHSTVTDIKIIPIRGLIITLGADNYKFELLEEGSSFTAAPIRQGGGDREKVVAVRLDITAVVMPNNLEDIEPDLMTIDDGTIDQVRLQLLPKDGQSGGGEMHIGLVDPAASVALWLFEWSVTSSEHRPKATISMRGYFSRDVLDNGTYPFFKQISGWS